jgi:pimeloyl-ACP methyl ester carboxylesterase
LNGVERNRRVFEKSRRLDDFDSFANNLICAMHRIVFNPSKERSMTPRMLNHLRIFAGLALALLFAFAATAQTPSPAATISSRDEVVDGLKLRYLTAGHGAPLILLHGYAETSRMWRPIMPELARRFMVIAPDLPGIGDSEIPADGLDMKTSAIRIHALAKKLGIRKAEVVGHDIGLMVAYAYAAMYPSETQKLVLMDAFLPGVDGWQDIFNSPMYWHFRFHGPTPEALVQGRERIFFSYFWNDLAADKNHSLSPADREAYIGAYSRPGRMRAGWAYFVSFQQAAKDFAQLSQTKLTMPVLTIGGDKSLGDFLAIQIKLVANNVTSVTVKNSGHWVIEESPQETADALYKFL